MASLLAFARWALFRLLLLIIVLMGAITISNNLPLSVGPFAEDYRVMAYSFIAVTLALLLYRPLLARADGEPPEDLRINRLAGLHFLVGSTLAAMALALPVLLSMTMGRTPMVYPTVHSLALVVALSLHAAVIEEIIYRGFLLQLLLKLCHPVISALLVSFLFMLAHVFDGRDSINLLSVFIGGLGMTVAFFLTRTLWMAIRFHFAWDAVIFGIKYFQAVVPNSPRRFADADIWLLLVVQGIVLAGMTGWLVYRLMLSANDESRALASKDS